MMNLIFLFFKKGYLSGYKRETKKVSIINIHMTTPLMHMRLALNVFCFHVLYNLFLGE